MNVSGAHTSPPLPDARTVCAAPSRRTGTVRRVAADVELDAAGWEPRHRAAYGCGARERSRTAVCPWTGNRPPSPAPRAGGPGPAGPRNASGRPRRRAHRGRGGDAARRHRNPKAAGAGLGGHGSRLRRAADQWRGGTARVGGRATGAAGCGRPVAVPRTADPASPYRGAAGACMNVLLRPVGAGVRLTGRYASPGGVAGSTAQMKSPRRSTGLTASRRCCAARAVRVAASSRRCAWLCRVIIDPSGWRPVIGLSTQDR